MHYSDKQILSARGPKNRVDPNRPYGCLVEKERTVSGKIEEVQVIFLTNRECPFRCLMCDLWKNTTDTPVPVGAIPRQVEWARKQSPAVRHVKLYNSGSFFDGGAIPTDDHPTIASLLGDLETVIVESHPKFITDNCLSFRDLLAPELEVAVGLETVHSELPRKLNKKMTLDDFSQSIRFLTNHGIRTRAFILLRPPWLSEAEGIYWAKKSIDFAFKSGVECCTILPVRGGNGIMEELEARKEFCRPNVGSLEEVLSYGINLGAGRVFADTWDLGLFCSENDDVQAITDRLNAMNLSQRT